MSWQRYRNELMMAVALLFAVGSLMYKSHKHRSMAQGNQQMAQEITVLQEIISLKKIWGNKDISKKLDAVRVMIPPSNIHWQKRGRKLTATFTELQPVQVNKITSKILNIPIQIVRFKVKKTGETYRMEMQCKW